MGFILMNLGWWWNLRYLRRYFMEFLFLLLLNLSFFVSFVCRFLLKVVENMSVCFVGLLLLFFLLLFLLVLLLVLGFFLFNVLRMFLIFLNCLVLNILFVLLIMRNWSWVKVFCSFMLFLRIFYK